MFKNLLLAFHFYLLPSPFFLQKPLLEILIFNHLEAFVKNKPNFRPFYTLNGDSAKKQTQSNPIFPTQSYNKSTKTRKTGSNKNSLTKRTKNHYIQYNFGCRLIAITFQLKYLFVQNLKEAKNALYSTARQSNIP